MCDLKCANCTICPTRFRAATAELRGIIENAKPGVLDLFGLTQAIEAQLKRSTQGVDREISTSVVDTTSDVLDHGAYRIRLAVFRIIQEAVTNAVKHSGCRAISVRLSQTSDHIRIEVANDGSEPTEGWRRSTGGVNNIRVRAALIGAEVSFERGDGSKTHLECSFGCVEQPDFRRGIQRCAVCCVPPCCCGPRKRVAPVGEHGMNILIAEDDPFHRSFLSNTVRNALPSCETLYEAVDGKEAIDIVLKKEIDGVVMDLQMPVFSGIAAASTIWAKRPDMRILFWSNYSDEAYVRGISRIVPKEAQTV